MIGCVKMRKTLTVIFIIIPLIVIAACQSNSQHDEIVKMSISNSNGIGQVNTDFFTEYEDEETIQIIEDIISTASKVDGIVDMIDPEYDLEITYANGDKEGIHIWMGEQGERGTIMYVDNTHTIYYVSEEDKKQLLDLISN